MTEPTSASRFCCKSLSNASSKDLKQISDFEPIMDEGKGLALYLKQRSIHDEGDNVMRTYLVKDVINDELVGYFSLKAGLISLEDAHESEDGGNLQTIPGIELANFAVNKHYRIKHPKSQGSGKYIFSEYVVDLFTKASEIIGIKVLYIFALPYEKLIANYLSYGFKRLSKEEEDSLHSRIKPTYDSGCIFMYLVL